MSERVTVELPLDERIYYALMDAGFDEDEAQSASDVAVPMFSQALREIAAEVEWRFRSMSFSCGQGEATSRLHRSGDHIRKYADALTPPASDRVARVAEGGGL